MPSSLWLVMSNYTSFCFVNITKYVTFLTATPVSVSNKANDISYVYTSGQVSDDISSETNIEPSISGGIIS